MTAKHPHASRPDDDRRRALARVAADTLRLLDDLTALEDECLEHLRATGRLTTEEARRWRVQRAKDDAARRELARHWPAAVSYGDGAAAG